MPHGNQNRFAANRGSDVSRVQNGGPALFDGTALVTGASSGIGRELARELAPGVRAMVLVARRRDRLQQLGAELSSINSALELHLEPCDLASPDSVNALIESLERSSQAIDLLVNNAGVGQSQLFERTQWADVRSMLEVNVAAVLKLTHFVLPKMVARRSGIILNIGSGAGRAFMPNAAVYTASKHFLRAFTDAVRAEVTGTGVRIVEAAPGPVETEFDDRAGIVGGATPGQRLFRISARECAREILHAMGNGQDIIFPGRNYRWLMRLQPFMPRRAMVAQVAAAARKLRQTSRLP